MARELNRANWDQRAAIHGQDRYYDPSTGQFLSVDPAFSLTQAPYSYANDNPVNEEDPLGLWGCATPARVVKTALTLVKRTTPRSTQTR